MIQVYGRRFVFNWKVSLFALICLGVFINLGLWQMSREDEKRHFLAQQAERVSQPAIVANELPDEGELYGLPVVLSGRFDQQAVFLLDNRVLNGKVGFEVQQVFHDTSGQAFLVNRGFVQMGRTRQDPVDIPSVSEQPVSIKGYIYQRDNSNVAMQNGDIAESSYPIIVQHTDIVQFGNRQGTLLYPHVIRLLEGESGALPRYWPDTTMPPEKHRGYAIQWFTMAFAVTLAWLFFSVRQDDPTENM